MTIMLRITPGRACEQGALISVLWCSLCCQGSWCAHKWVGWWGWVQDEEDEKVVTQNTGTLEDSYQYHWGHLDIILQGLPEPSSIEKLTGLPSCCVPDRERAAPWFSTGARLTRLQITPVHWFFCQSPKEHAELLHLVFYFIIIAFYAA